MVAVSAMVVVVGTDSKLAEAAPLSQFDPGNIISDAKFFDGGALSAGEVQSFLNAKVPVCRSSAGSPPCLRNYSTEISSRAARAGRCDAIAGRANQSAAEVIYTVGKACGISQKALLVLLEKEQGLVTATAPAAFKYRIATGFGCPDTAACDTSYYGFFNQVYSAAYQFKTYAATPNSWNFAAGRTSNIGYHPNAACGSKSVTVRNQATAGLYNYTPYTPNVAALNSGYGLGDGCSAYGNRNFWLLFTDWFGSTIAGSAPFGGMDVTAAPSGEIQVNGWAIDPDTLDPVDIHVYVDGVGAGIGKADASRPDVGAAYPRYGDDRGIDMRVVAATGRREVCAYAIDATGDANSLLGCDSISIVNKSPFGGMNAFSTQYSGSITVNGWTIDPETSAPIDVDIRVNGRSVSRTAADFDRPDVGRVYPSAGARHGINVTVPAEPGINQVCAIAINVANGANVPLGCDQVEVDSLAPFGGMDARASHRAITVNGWTIDPEIKGPVEVKIYVNDVLANTTTASANRPDVGRVYPAYGAAHGINTTFTSDPGPKKVCAVAVNVQRGDDTALGCQTVTVVDLSPFGGMDAQAIGDEVLVRGWTIDPDTTEPIDVHVYVDGVGAAITRADAFRPDVEQVYPAFGSNRGINVQFPARAGARNVCAYGINVAQGTNTLLGCQTVNVSG